MKLMLVDDHALFRTGVVYALQEVEPGAVIEQFSLLAPAMSELGAGNTPDLLILDLNTPGYKELAALELLRERFDHVPVLVLSAHEEPEIVERAIELGACGYVPKSAPPEALYAALRLVLAGGVYVPGSSLSTSMLSPLSSEEKASANDVWAKLGVRLTPRQRDVLLGLVQGKPNKVIAKDLGLSDGTIKTHVAHVFDALAVNNRTQVAFKLARMGVGVRELQASAPD
jgi:DNA-binding NarL/FixJ family response regulator